jgi:hypothetical protein
LFAGLSKRVDLKLVSRLEFRSGTVAMQRESVLDTAVLRLSRRSENRRSTPIEPAVEAARRTSY